MRARALRTGLPDELPARVGRWLAYLDDRHHADVLDRYLDDMRCQVRERWQALKKRAHERPNNYQRIPSLCEYVADDEWVTGLLDWMTRACEENQGLHLYG